MNTGIALQLKRQLRPHLTSSCAAQRTAVFPELPLRVRRGGSAGRARSDQCCNVQERPLLRRKILNK